MCLTGLGVPFSHRHHRTNRITKSAGGTRAECRTRRPRCRTVNCMSAQPTDHTGPYEVIHLGGEAAAIVPLADLRRLRAV